MLSIETWDQIHRAICSLDPNLHPHRPFSAYDLKNQTLFQAWFIWHFGPLYWVIACCYYSRSRLHRRSARQGWDFCVHFSYQWETSSKEIFPSVKSVSDGAGTLCGRGSLQQDCAFVSCRVCILVAFTVCAAYKRKKWNKRGYEATNKAASVGARELCESPLPHSFGSFLFVRWANIQTVIKLGINWNLGKVRLTRINQPGLNHPLFT